MQKSFRCWAALAACMLLTGCIGSRETDLSKRYSDYFRYSFGEDYKCYFTEHEKGNTPRDWYSLEYRTADGTVRQGDSTAFDVIPYKDNRLSDKQTKDAYYFSCLELLAEKELSYHFRTGLAENVIKPHIGSVAVSQNGNYRIDEDDAKGLLMTAVTQVFYAGQEENGREIAEALYQPDTGLKLSEQTAESIVQDPRLYVTMVLSLDADADSSAFLERFEAVMEDFRALDPQNYSVVVTQRSDDEDSGSSRLFTEYGILGEIVDADARMKEQGEDYSFREDIRASYLAKYQLS